MAFHIQNVRLTGLWLVLLSRRRSAVPMSSPDSSEDGAAGPNGSNFATSRASDRSQGLGGRGSDSGRSVHLVASGRVSKHSARHGAHRHAVGFSTTCPQPAATQPSTPLSQWNVVLDALAELRSEIDQLKLDRRCGPPPSPAPVAPAVSPSPRPSRVNDRAGPSHGPTCSASPGNFSGFGAASSDEEVAGATRPPVGLASECQGVWTA